MPKNSRESSPRRARVRLIWLSTALLTAMTLSACAPAASKAEKKPVVLTTFSVIADIARAVGGDHVQVQSITKVGAEIHGYEPTPGDIRHGASADLIVENGWGLEAWFDRFTSSIKVPVLTLTDGLEPIDIASDAYAGKPNPHAWMSPLNVQHYAKKLSDAFSKLAPEHAADFAANAATYSAQLQQVHDDLTRSLSQLPAAKRTLVTCEGAFSYLTRDAGLKEVYMWPVNAEQQVTPQRMAAVIEAVKQDQVPAVFCESTVSDRSMRQVVSATGSTFGGTLYVDSLSLPDGPVPTYLDLIKYDVKTITDALGAAK